MPDVVDGDRITANPDQLRSAGREWGGKAGNYDRMNHQLATAEAKLPPGKFSGAAGEAMRGYMSRLTSATGTLAEAYNKIATRAPRVADAVEHAKQAQDKCDRTKQAADAAKKELTAATEALHDAERAVSAARSAHGVLGEVAAAAAKVALAAARARYDTARTDHEAKAKAARAARTAFEEAEHTRKRVSDAFADMVNEQTAVIRAAVPPAPPAPNVPALASQLGVLGTGAGGLQGLLGGQFNIAKNLIDPSTVRVGRNGLVRLPDSVKVYTPGELAQLKGLAKWSSRLGHAGNVAGVAFPLVTSTLEAVNNPNLTPQQKQDYIVNHVLLEAGGGALGGAVCAPAGAGASFVCGTLGGEAGKALEKSRLARRGTDFVSHNVVNPMKDPVMDIANGDYGKALRDYSQIQPKIIGNLGRSAFHTATHPGELKGVYDDAVHDGNGLLKGVGHLLGVPDDPKGIDYAGPAGPKDPTYQPSNSA